MEVTSSWTVGHRFRPVNSLASSRRGRRASRFPSRIFLESTLMEGDPGRSREAWWEHLLSSRQEGNGGLDHFPASREEVASSG